MTHIEKSNRKSASKKMSIHATKSNILQNINSSKIWNKP